MKKKIDDFSLRGITLKRSSGEIQTLDLQKFRTDIDAKDLQNKVDNSYKIATAMRLNYTPSVFVNGELIRNPASYEEFKTIIESAIKANP